MSENITHTAIVDDCARLILHAPVACKPFKQALRRHLDVAQLGGITRHGDRHNPGLLADLRSRYRDNTADDQDVCRLAFVLGWLSHRAADRQMKRIWRLEIPGEPATGSPTDCSIYHDALLFREHYASGTRPPYSVATPEAELESLPAAAVLDVPAVESVLRAMWQRMLISMHTFIPDDDHIGTWLDNVIARHQRLTVDLHRYARAIAAPDPAKVRRYITDINFYDADDPIIAMAKELRETGTTPATLIDAMTGDANGSRYAMGLCRALRYVLAANDFFLFRIEREELVSRLDIGKPECED